MIDLDERDTFAQILELVQEQDARIADLTVEVRALKGVLTNVSPELLRGLSDRLAYWRSQMAESQAERAAKYAHKIRRLRQGRSPLWGSQSSSMDGLDLDHLMNLDQ